MKIFFRRVVILSALAFIPKTVMAADPLAVAPDMYSLLFENQQVRVMKVKFQPGQKIKEHSHPDHYVVVEKPGKLRVFTKDGEHQDVDLKQDQVLWMPAQTHWAENIGSTPVELVVNELKPAH